MRIKNGSRPQASTSDVYQTVAFKVGMKLALDVAEMSPAELMHEYDAESIRVSHLRGAFDPEPKYIDSNTTNEELGDLISSMITAALDKARS